MDKRNKNLFFKWEFEAADVDKELRDLLNKDIMSQKQTFENIIISNIEDD